MVPSASWYCEEWIRKAGRFGHFGGMRDSYILIHPLSSLIESFFGIYSNINTNIKTGFAGRLVKWTYAAF